MAADVPKVPDDHWLLGNLSAFRDHPLELVVRSTHFGDLVRWRFAWTWFYQANHPDRVHDVLVKHAASFYKTPRIKQVLGNVLGEGLLISDGETWRRRRRLVQPAFHSSRIESYGQTMTAYTLAMMDRWAPGGEYDMRDEMMKLTLGIVAKTLFDADMQGDLSERVGRAVTISQEHGNQQFGRLLTSPSWLPTSDNRRGLAAVNDLDAILADIIQTRRSSREDRGDLLSMLLLSRDEDGSGGLTDRQVRDEAMTLFLAGHETTAVALTWTWVLLHQHPTVLEKLEDEVDRVLRGRTPGVQDLPDLPYVNQVIQESMRLYPPAWITGRRAIEPVDIGPYRLDASSIVLVSPYAVHRQAEYFPDPEVFNPDRFSGANLAKLPRYAYIPFGGGPRICIGNHFAMQEAQLILASMTQKVRLELLPGSDLTPEPLITLRPKFPVMMRVTRRQASPSAQAA
jgi:cytochrome P450